MAKKKNPNAFTVDSQLRCTQCGVDIHVATGPGYHNLELHTTSKACKDRQKAVAQSEKKSQSLLDFFSTQKPAKLNVPRVVTPPPVHADPIQSINAPGQTLLPPSSWKLQDEPITTLPPTNNGEFDRSQGCPHAIGMLSKLQEKMESIPKETPLAGPQHPLAIFSEHPDECASGAGVPEEDWEEILNPKMNSAFGCGHDSIEEGFERRGPNGMDGAPCTNIPIHGPICGPKHPAVWRYSLGAHFHTKHRLAPTELPVRVQQSASEMNGMEQIWKKRFQIRKKRNLKNKKALPLIISTAYSVGLSENLDFDPENEEDLSDVNGSSSSSDQSSDSDEDMDHEIETSTGERETEAVPESVENIETETVSIEETHPSLATNTQEPLLTINEEGSDNSGMGDMEGTEPAVELEASIGTRRSSGRVRKRMEMDSRYECDTLITLEEKEAGTQVMECKARGCETGWFHLDCMDFEFVPKNWMCSSCKPGKRHRVGA